MKNRIYALFPAITVMVLLTCNQAFALQPLDAFLKSAGKNNPKNLEATANTRASNAAAVSTLGQLLPSVSINGSYARNQYEVSVDFPISETVIQTIVISPDNQFSTSGVIRIPLMDLAGITRTTAANISAHSAKLQEDNTSLQTEAQVVQAYYQLVAYVALVSASEKALDVEKASLLLAQDRFEAGKTASLDLDRARAEVERRFQILANAKLQVVVTARSLRSLSGMEPELSNAPELADDLHEEPPLDSFQSAEKDLPGLYAAIEARRAQEKQAVAQRLVLVPLLSFNFSETGTNASAFSGHDWTWQGMAMLSWNLDVPTFARISVQNAQLAAATARETGVRLAVRDAIHRIWNEVSTGIARCRSAQTEVAVSERASELARDRYETGAATQLDLLQAQRDAFTAQVTRIQVFAELINARAQLRIASGHSLISNTREMQ